MTKEEFDEMIKTVLEGGVTLSLFIKDGILWYNMNTEMKSHLHVALIDGKCVCEGRYEHKAEIKDLDDLLAEVRNCDYGRGFMNSEWVELLSR